MSDIDAASASGSRSGGGRRRRATSPQPTEDAPPTPPKRPRGRPRKTLPVEVIQSAAVEQEPLEAAEEEPEIVVPPPAPRPRGRPRKSVMPAEPVVAMEDSIAIVQIDPKPVAAAPAAEATAPVKRGRGRPRKSVPAPAVVEPIDDGDEAEPEDNDDGTVSSLSRCKESCVNRILTSDSAIRSACIPRRSLFSAQIRPII